MEMTEVEMNATLDRHASASALIAAPATNQPAATTPHLASPPAVPSAPTPAHTAQPHQPPRTLAPTPPRAYAAPTLTGGTPRTQRNRVVALAGYPQQICGQLVGLWITQGHRGDNPVADRMTPAGAGRGEWG
ncbi:hypothetical protein GCM10009565_63460 [Amycolatopsis albidoflavus]